MQRQASGARSGAASEVLAGPTGAASSTVDVNAAALHQDALPAGSSAPGGDTKPAARRASAKSKKEAAEFGADAPPARAHTSVTTSFPPDVQKVVNAITWGEVYATVAQVHLSVNRQVTESDFYNMLGQNSTLYGYAALTPPSPTKAPQEPEGGAKPAPVRKRATKPADPKKPPRKRAPKAAKAGVRAVEAS